MSILTEDTFILYAAKYYDNPQCHSTEEFYEDVKRFQYLRRLFGKYSESGEMNERLVLNHIIIIYNLFNDQATEMLFFKLKNHYKYLKPFLVLLGRMPEYLVIDGEKIYSSDIPMEPRIIEVLRKI